MTLKETLKNRQKEDWLICDRANQFYDLVESYRQFLQQWDNSAKVLLIETNPLHFLAKFCAAVIENYPIFLCNPHWEYKEWEQVFLLVQPNLIWGKLPDSSSHFKESKEVQTIPLEARIMIPTGGTSGKIKFALHDGCSLSASVQGFQKYFAQKSINSFCILPLYHVSGLMQFLRSLLTGGKIVILPYQSLKQGEIGITNPRDFFISLVPTQLQSLLDLNPQWLSLFQTVLLGGAPPWKKLLDRARQCKIKLSPTYGMTETASGVVTLKPAVFLEGNESSGQVLPHATLEILGDRETKLAANQIGTIHIQAKSNYWGYYPHPHRFLKTAIATDDLGYLDEEGYLYLVGRKSHKIITGGENVFPVEVETAILATNLVRDACVVGIPDPTWGEAIAAAYVPQKSAIAETEIQQALAGKLSKFKQPKYWLALPELPRCDRGKLNYSQIKQLFIPQK
ncbi:MULTISPECIES: 2-succinylbenzoate--CoA ligase [Spirulina sp. CCY15215]|uniref:2-succinylbenzoate--CoA ligase n=1 Tax=Spirulina sp. CCY15215 TaxID=2767591 RepID=UPI00194E4C70|nr:2-succinylbenzoate--CoA ligase [Spirulina major]